VLALGAQAAQLGTAVVVCAESGAPAAHKKATACRRGPGRRARSLAREETREAIERLRRAVAP
jgi:NAD(P)H-dependent flavin oxidoreductase YrpB (nitropropane dioxygenase family)